LNGLTAGLSGINNTLSSQILSKLNAMDNFAKAAWQTTRIQKVLDALNLALTLHNAAMLSRNLVGSFGDIISATTNNILSLIKNEQVQSININETIGNTIENFLKSILGESTYQGVSENFNKYSRIINATANIINSIQSIMAGLAEGLEIMGRYTGKIGNALKKSGAVLENSYHRYTDKPNGHQFKILARNQSDAVEIIGKLLNITNDTYSSELLKKNEAINTASAYPTIPPNQIILGKTYKEPRKRPLADVRFQYASIKIWGLPKPIILVDKTGYWSEAIIKAW
jgi:hypothetical protein